MEFRKAAKSWNFSRAFIALFFLLISLANAQKEVCHSRPTDLVFVVDGSRSVRPWHFKSTKDAVKDMVDSLEEIGPDAVQVGLIQYGSVVKQEFALGQFQTREEVNDAIDGIEYMEGGTRTGSALRFLFSKTFRESQGARNRPGVAKVAVVITDGLAQDARAAQIWQKKVKDFGVEIFAIGVGRRISHEDLTVLASEPKKTHTHYVKDFSLIQNLPEFLKNEICVMEVDECKLGTANCQHICKNTIGSFYCSCEEGYQLQPDGKTCLAVKPAYPVDLTLSDPTHTTMRAAWNLDDPTRNETVEYYLVTYEPTDGSGVRKEIRVDEREVLLEGLTPDTEYNVTVKSVGREMESPSVSDTETTLALGETSVTLSNPTMTSLQAEWEPAGGDRLSGYSVQVVEVGKNGQKDKIVVGASRDLPHDVTELTIANLDPGKAYRVTVTPVHGKLLGKPGSDEENTLNLEPPEVTVTDATFTTAVVEWTGIGMPADSYIVRLFSSDGVDGLEGMLKEVPGNTMSALFDGLEPGTRYTAVVNGFVDKEKTIASPEGSNDGTTRSPPTPDVKVTDSGLSIMDVMWTVSGPTPDHFVLQFNPVNDVFNLQQITTEDLSATLHDLQPDTEYNIKVIAVYEEEEREIRSEVGSATGKTKILHAPEVDALYETLTTGTVEWGDIGMEADSWRVEYFHEDEEKKSEEVDGAEASIKMSGLAPGKLYTAQVTGFVKEDGKTFQSPTGEDTVVAEALPPPEVDITLTGLTVASVSWTAEKTPGGLIPTKYNVIYFPTNNPRNLTKFSTEDTSANLTGLQPGTEYKVKVVAEYEDPHELGTVIKSPVGQDRDSTGTLPPPDVTITGTTTTTLDVSWTLDVDVTQFVVDIIKGEEEVPNELDEPSENAVTVNGNINKMTFEDLTPGSRYTVLVWPKVIEGENEVMGPPGNDVNKTKPDPPADLLAGEIFGGILNVTFRPPEGNADSYEVKCVPEGADPEEVDTSWVDADDDLVAQCSYVAPGVKYTILIRTIYGDEKSDWAQVSETTGVGPVQNFILSEPTTHSIVATWEPPANVDVVDAYILRYFPAGSENETIEIEVPGTETRHVLENLFPETLYAATINPIVRSVRGPEASDSEVTLEDNVAIKITDVGYNTIDVEWPKSTISGVSYILHWELLADPDLMWDRQPVEQKSFEPGAMRGVITNVLPGSTYIVTIEYVYPFGGPKEAEAQATTLAPPPGPLTFTEITEVNYIVHWGVPGFGAKPLKYEVEFTWLDEEGIPLNEVAYVEPWELSAKHGSLSPGTLVNVSVSARYHAVRSGPTKGQVTTLVPKEAVCTCQTYLTKQNEMQRTMQSLVDVINALSTKIGNLESAVAAGKETSESAVTVPSYFKPEIRDLNAGLPH